MADFNFTRIQSGDFISAAEYNRLCEEVTKLTSITGYGLEKGGFGVALPPPDSNWIYARLTQRFESYDRIRYSWVEVLPDGEGNWLDTEAGASGNEVELPAFELNNRIVPTSTIVVLYKGNANFTLFAHPGGDEEEDEGGQPGSTGSDGSNPDANLVWYSYYSYLEAPLVHIGQVLDTNVKFQIGTLKGGVVRDSHLRFAVGDGVPLLSPLQFSIIGQTLPANNWLQFPEYGQRSPLLQGPFANRFTSEQVGLIRTRTHSPVDRVNQNWYVQLNLMSLFGYEFYAMELNDLGAGNQRFLETEAGEKVYNACWEEDVSTAVYHVEYQGTDKGWIVILQHNLDGGSGSGSTPGSGSEGSGSGSIPNLPDIIDDLVPTDVIVDVCPIYTPIEIPEIPAAYVGVPASAGAVGEAGDMSYDSSYIYLCVATNTWKRVAISTW